MGMEGTERAKAGLSIFTKRAVLEQMNSEVGSMYWHCLVQARRWPLELLMFVNGLSRDLEI